MDAERYAAVETARRAPAAEGGFPDQTAHRIRVRDARRGHGGARAREPPGREERVGAPARDRGHAGLQDRRARQGRRHLLGRVTYQIFASFWPTAPKDEGFADRINALPKYVVTKTLERLDWENSHVIDGDVAEQVRTLKEQPGEGDLLLLGSADVLDALLEHELIDEVRLEVYPVVLG